MKYSSYMKRTVSIKLLTSPEQAQALTELQTTFNAACNLVVPFAVSNRCWNRVALHHLAYYPVREQSALGSQMVCNAIAAVAEAYKALKLHKADEMPTITFDRDSSVHFDKRTYSLQSENVLSLFTLTGRIYVPFASGDFQRAYLAKGVCKEAELLQRHGIWFFHLVLDLPDVPPVTGGGVLGIDLGENNLATTSSGMMMSGVQLRHERDKYWALRRRLQSNGSKSAKQRLTRLSGREERHVRHVNHEMSKQLVQEAIRTNASLIALEDLTHIRDRIRAGKRVRSRLHRWAWRQLQTFIEYKADAAGIRTVYVNPSYTSQTCSVCGQRGTRQKHRFTCSCGSFARMNADENASRNIAKLALPAGNVTGLVSARHVEGFLNLL